MAFIPKDYETVSSRINRFWQSCPAGRIHTEIVLINEKEIVIKASIYTDREDPRPVSVDFAQETVGSSQVNKTSWVENCATSAIGRALATLGFTNGNRPSLEEMQKTTREPYAAAKGDWLARAANCAGQGDIEGLRAVYELARKESAPAEVLKSIEEFATALKAV